MKKCHNTYRPFDFIFDYNIKQNPKRFCQTEDKIIKEKLLAKEKG